MVLNNLFSGVITAIVRTAVILPMPLLTSENPPQEEIEAIKTSGYWRVVVGYPLAYIILAVTIRFLFIPYDSPKNAITNGNLEEAKLSVKSIYVDAEDPEEVMSFMTKNISEDTNNVSAKDALCHPDHRRLTYILFGIIFIYFINSMIFL